jgi:hypothetical protein
MQCVDPLPEFTGRPLIRQRRTRGQAHLGKIPGPCLDDRADLELDVVRDEVENAIEAACAMKGTRAPSAWPTRRCR